MDEDDLRCNISGSDEEGDNADTSSNAGDSQYSRGAKMNLKQKLELHQAGEFLNK